MRFPPVDALHSYNLHDVIHHSFWELLRESLHGEGKQKSRFSRKVFKYRILIYREDKYFSAWIWAVDKEILIKTKNCNRTEVAKKTAYKKMEWLRKNTTNRKLRYCTYSKL